MAKLPASILSGPRPLLPSPRPGRQQIIELVKERMGEDPRRDTNERGPAFVRYVAMHLMQKSGYSLPEIGRAFKRRHSPAGMHHTTVLYGVNQIKQFRVENAEVDAVLRELEASLGQLPRTVEKSEGVAITKLLPPTVRREDVLRSMLREEIRAALAEQQAASAGGAEC